MKKLLVIITIFVFFVKNTQAQFAGTSIVLQEPKEVTMMNPYPFEGQSHIRYGEECLALDGAMLTVVNVFGDSILARYTPDGYGDGSRGWEGPSSCPCNAIFFIKKGEFNLIQKNQKAEDARTISIMMGVLIKEEEKEKGIIQMRKLLYESEHMDGAPDNAPNGQ